MFEDVTDAVAKADAADAALNQATFGGADTESMRLLIQARDDAYRTLTRVSTDENLGLHRHLLSNGKTWGPALPPCRCGQ